MQSLGNSLNTEIKHQSIWHNLENSWASHDLRVGNRSGVFACDKCIHVCLATNALGLGSCDLRPETNAPPLIVFRPLTDVIKYLESDRRLLAVNVNVMLRAVSCPCTNVRGGNGASATED